MSKKNGWHIRLQPKLLAGVLLMAVALLAALTPLMGTLYRSQTEAYYSELAFDQATIAAELIDGDRIETYYQTGEKDDYYEEIRRYLLFVKQTVGLKYFYVVVPEDEVMVYIWDAGEANEDGVCELGDVDSYYGGGDELMHAAFRGAEHTILITNDDVYGYLASAYVPIYNSAGEPVALASVDISIDMINDQITQFSHLILLSVLGVLAVSTFAYYFFVNRALIRPLKQLHQAAHGLVTDRMDHLEDFSIDIHTGDELEGLAQAFQFMTRELNTYISDLTRVTAEKERIGAELNVATHIQASMLPCIFPAFPERPEFDIYATMAPAKEVGGDFYDFFLVDDDHLAVVVADVSGKGVPAALFMVIAKTLIKDHAQTGSVPEDVFAEVNRQLCESNDEGLFVTAWMGVLELSTGKVTFVNAGHNPPLIGRAGEGYEYLQLRPGFVLAGMEMTRYKPGSFELRPGDSLYLYTDGVTEATDTREELYGEDRLKKVLDAHLADAPEHLLPAVKADIDAFVGEAPQFDDITMVSVRYFGPGGR